MTAPTPGYLIRSRESCPDDSTEYVFICSEPNCDSLVEQQGDLCGRCQSRLDNAIDHREWPDPVFWSTP